MEKNEWDVKLFETIKNGQQIEVIKECLKNGADVTVKDNTGITPLHWICNENKDHQNNNKNIEIYELTKLLIDNGADVNAEDEYFKETPLFWATSNKGTVSYMHDITKLLIENGADVNHKNKDGKTPLMVAANSVNIEAVEFLIENGADINAKDKFGSTALNYANKVITDDGSDKQIIDFLVEKGARRGTTTESERIKYKQYEEQDYLDYLGLDLTNSNNEEPQTIRKRHK